VAEVVKLGVRQRLVLGEGSHRFSKFSRRRFTIAPSIRCGLASQCGGYGGITLIGPDGRFELAHNTPASA
jgi:hypothetical protein